jgi:hypothetical protein
LKGAEHSYPLAVLKQFFFSGKLSRCLARDLAANRVHGADVIRFREEYCRVPEGRPVREQIKLDDCFFWAVYDNPAGPTRRDF